MYAQMNTIFLYLSCTLGLTLSLNNMFNALGWPTIEKRYSFKKAVLTYNALNNLTPLYISELLIPMSQTHNQNTKVNFKQLFSGTQIEYSNI